MKSFICLIFLCIFMYSGHGFDPFSYDHSKKTECLVEPPLPAAQTGGLVLCYDVEDDRNAENWRLYGNGAIREVAGRVQIHRGHIYSFSAWVKMREGDNNRVGVVFMTEDGGFVHGGEVMAKEGCWSLLKGGIVPDFSGPVKIFLQSDYKTATISVENVLLQQFTKREWRLKQDQVIDKIRKSKVRFQVMFRNKTAVKGATISINQIKPAFPLGCAMNYRILESQGYRDWFASRFKFTSFTNEMKWYTTETARARENYTLADSMLNFTQEHGISVRGHTVLWDNPKMQPQWVQRIKDPKDLLNVTLNRINSVVTRYKGKVFGWDVVNENLHFSYFEDMLGENASSSFYSMASKLDPDITMFLNEFNTIELSSPGYASPVNLTKKMQEVLAYPGNEKMKGGFGLEGHFGPGQPNLAHIRSAFDILGSLGFPLWITELDIRKSPDQVKYLEEILREAYSHPAVKGIIMFGGPEVSKIRELTFADQDFKNTPTGDLVDRLLKEWKLAGSREIVTANLEESLKEEEEDGEVRFSHEVSLFHGHYRVSVSHPWMKKLSTSLSFEVSEKLGDNKLVQIVI